MRLARTLACIQQFADVQTEMIRAFNDKLVVWSIIHDEQLVLFDSKQWPFLMHVSR